LSTIIAKSASKKLANPHFKNDKSLSKNRDFWCQAVKNRLFRENQNFGICGLFSFPKCNSCLNSEAVNHFRIFNKKRCKIFLKKCTSQRMKFLSVFFALLRLCVKPLCGVWVEFVIIDGGKVHFLN